VPTLDRHVLRRFLANLLAIYVVVICLFVLVDLVMDMDEFVEAGHDRADELGGFWLATLRVAFDFYYPLVVLITIYIASLLTVAAIGFTFSGMSRNGEMTGVLCGGVSLYRLAAPVLGAACLVIVGTLPLQEYVIPPMADRLIREKRDVGRDTMRDYPIYFIEDGDGSLLSARRFLPASRELRDVVIRQREPALRISAAQALWDETHQRWDLFTVTALRPRLTPLEQGGTVTPPPAPDHFVTDLSPRVLMAQRARFLPRMLGLGDLYALRNNPALGDADRPRLDRLIWSRFSFLVAQMLIVATVLPLFLTREQTNPLRQASLAAAIALGAWAGTLVTIEVAGLHLNPIAAAWLPTALLLPVAASAVADLRT